MLHMDITNFSENIFDVLERTIQCNTPVTVHTKNGNAVVVSEADYKGLRETLSLYSIPGMKNKLIMGRQTPLDECLPEHEVQW